MDELSKDEKNIVPSDLSGVKIMWVEDDTALNTIMEKWLSQYDATLTHTTHGEKALEMLRQNKPDILLLDILLPDINGFEVLKEMKADENLKDIPVILFSNLNHQEDMDQGYKLGAVRFMVKSTVFLEGLADEIKKVLEEHKSA